MVQNSWQNIIKSLLTEKEDKTDNKKSADLKTNDEISQKTLDYNKKQLKNRSLESLADEYCTRENPVLYSIYDIYKKSPDDIKNKYEKRLHDILNYINVEAYQNHNLVINNPLTTKILDGLKTEISTDYEKHLQDLRGEYNYNDDEVFQRYKTSLAAKTKGNKYLLNTIFLLYNGINPVLLDGVPLYDEENDKMVVLADIPKDNQFFKDNEIDADLLSKPEEAPEYQTFGDDELMIKSYVTNRVDPDEYTYNVTYVKDYSETYPITIDDFLETIYNNPINTEAIQKASKGKFDLLNDRKVINILKDKEFSKRKEKEKEDIQALRMLLDDSIIVGQLEELNKFYESELNKHKLSAGSKLKTSYLTKFNQVKDTLIEKKKLGFKDEDIRYILGDWIPYLKWETNNDIQTKLEVLKREMKKKEIPEEYLTSNLHQWYQKELTGKELDNAMKDFYQTMIGKHPEKLNNVKEAFYGKPIKKAPSIKDPGEVAEAMWKLGIHSKFKLVNIERAGIIDKTSDTVIKPTENVVIVGFANADQIRRIIELREQLKDSGYYEAENNLKACMQDKNTTYDTFIQNKQAFDNAQINNESALKELKKLERITEVLVKKCDEHQIPVGKAYSINLDKIYEELKKPYNANAELDIVKYDTEAPFRNKNEHKFYYEKLSDDAIRYLVDKAIKNYEDEIPHNLTIPHGLTPDTYKDYWGTKILLKTLFLAEDPAFENGFKTMTKDKKVVAYAARMGYNPDSKMNAIPKASITKLV